MSYPSSCVKHDKKWHLVSQRTEEICAKCSQIVWSSPLESDSVRKDLLTLLETSLRYGSHLSTTLSNAETLSSGETIGFIASIIGLIYYSNRQIRHLAKNCLNLLITQMNEQSVIEFIFEDIIKNIYGDKDYWNESSLDFMAELMSDICLATNPLRDEMDILFQRLLFDFRGLNDSLKTSVLRIFNELYAINADNELFLLDDDFHMKTLMTMIFNTFEALNNHLNDRQLVLQSIKLLRKLSKIESILKLLAKDSNLMTYFQKLLNTKYIDISNALLQLIYHLLDEELNSNEYIRRSLAIAIDKEMMDSLIECLNNCPNISTPLLECLFLILENSPQTRSESKLNFLCKAVIKSLQYSVRTKENKLFLIALSVLQKIIKCNPNSETHFLEEFNFFLIIDLLEDSVSSPVLFQSIALFCSEFFKLQFVPIVIPTKRMIKFLTKVLVNVCHTFGQSDDEFERISGAVLLIKSYLKLINDKKDSELDSNTNETHFINVEKHLNCDDIYLDEYHQNDNWKEASKRTDIYEFLSFCLQQIEPIFAKALKTLSNKWYSDNNLRLFEEICKCFEILITNDLFPTEDIELFLIKLCSEGYILSVMQLFWNREPLLNRESFVSALSCLLSVFVCKMRDSEPITSDIFDLKDIQMALIESKDPSKYIKDYLDERNSKLFVDIFFAINYYCHKFLIKENFGKIESEFKEMYHKILNTYLQNYLSEDKDLIPNIKYSLFLSSVSNLEDKSLEALQQFFEHKDDSFYCKYYTNHTKLLMWLFSDLKCDAFSELGLKRFIRDIPESYHNFNEKQKISAFFELIYNNEKALQILINSLCDTTKDNSTIDVILAIIEDCEQFIDESILYNSWRLFYNKVCEQMETIVKKLIDRIEAIISGGVIWYLPFHSDSDSDLELDLEDDVNISSEDCQIVNPDTIDQIIKLLSFLCGFLTNERNFNEFQTFGDKFNELLERFCDLIDKHLDDSSVRAIFKFFRLCLSSNRISGTIDVLLSEFLLNSKIGILSLFNYVNNDLLTDNETDDNNKETALFILSVVSNKKFIHNFEHQLVYELDITILMNLLNSESKVVAESAFILLKNSFKTKLYFESKEKCEEIKNDEMRKLIHCLQNGVFRQFITLPQITYYLSDLFIDLKQINAELMKALANSRWFHMIIDNYLEADQFNHEEDELQMQDIQLLDPQEDEDEERIDIILDKQRREKMLLKQERRRTRIFREEFIDFLLLFFELDFVNTTLIEVMNEMTNCFIQFIERPDDQMSELCASLRDKVLKFLKTIDSGVYGNHLTEQNIKQLKMLSQKQSTLNINVEHNYCIHVIEG